MVEWKSGKETFAMLKKVESTAEAALQYGNTLEADVFGTGERVVEDGVRVPQVIVDGGDMIIVQDCDA